MNDLYYEHLAKAFRLKGEGFGFICFLNKSFKKKNDLLSAACQTILRFLY